jgi:uncharacterized protein YecE (DUF72 family)
VAVASRFKKNADRLSRFLKRLPRRFHHAAEFRHQSWLDEEIHGILKRYGVANVSVSSQAIPNAFSKRPADFVYLRFHGLSGGSAHDYADRELEPWAERLRRSAGRGLIGFVYFNNDVNTRAPLNALRLMDIIGSMLRVRVNVNPLPWFEISL